MGMASSTTPAETALRMGSIRGYHNREVATASLLLIALDLNGNTCVVNAMMIC